MYLFGIVIQYESVTVTVIDLAFVQVFYIARQYKTQTFPWCALSSDSPEECKEPEIEVSKTFFPEYFFEYINFIDRTRNVYTTNAGTEIKFY